MEVIFLYTSYVASFTDAWIETKYPDVNRKDKGVASFTDAWIETMYGNYLLHLYNVASFTDAWIETSIALITSECLLRRIFYRCVD